MHKSLLKSKLKYEGKVFQTNNCGKIKVLKYNNSLSVDCIFIDTGTIVNTQSGRLKIGSIRDYMTPSVCSVGYIGSDISPSTDIKYAESYKKWLNMIERAYSIKCHVVRPNYEKCEVAKDWHNFTIFNKWFEINNIHGFEIDKDLLSSGTLYSENTCVFLPRAINMALQSDRVQSNKKLKTGVNFSDGVYYSNIRINGKKVYLGSFMRVNSAHDAWKKAKKLYLISLAEEYKDIISISAYNALLKWEYVRMPI